jgi:hypothetical protein
MYYHKGEHMTVPSDSKSLIEKLEEIYPDKYETDPVDLPEYWKKAGVVELLRVLRASIGSTELKDISARSN